MRVRFLPFAFVLLTIPLFLSAQIIPPNTKSVSVVDSGAACSVAAACAIWPVSAYPTVAMQITGTFTGTLTFEATGDNQTWFAVMATNLSTGAAATTTTTTGQYAISNVGLIAFRVRATAFASGGANISVTRGLASSANRAGLGGAISGTSGAFSGNVTSGGQFYASDGTALLPSYSFTSEPTLGFYRSGPLNVTLLGSQVITGALTVSSNINTSSNFRSGATGTTLSMNVADGQATFATANNAIGNRLKFDALPTVASGFGGSPAVTAGSTPFAGSVNVGTGGAATSGVLNFNGTAFPSAPFCVANSTAGSAQVAPFASTTQLTFNTTTAWAASAVLTWICVSSK